VEAARRAPAMAEQLGVDAAARELARQALATAARDAQARAARAPGGAARQRPPFGGFSTIGWRGLAG
jgi:hypothetical protein